MAGGRPKTNTSELPEGWYNEIIQLYADGAADIEIKALIGSWLGSFSNDLWDRWMREEPQFSETVNYGRMLAEAWWNNKGRLNLWEKSFNYVGFYMQMKNRFGWADKKEVKQETDLTVKGVDLKELVTFK